MIVDPLAHAPIDWTLKGLPPQAEGMLAHELGALRLSLFDESLFLPCAVLREPVLNANSEWMREFITATGVKFAPHGKTTMAPELFRMQVEHGAWAITAATIQHVRAYRRFGVQRIFMANQLVTEGAVGWIAHEMRRDPSFDFYSLVDSVEGVDLLVQALRKHSTRRPIQVLVEAGYPGGRTGVRTLEQGVRVAELVAQASPHLELVGIETFEGIHAADTQGEGKGRHMLESVRALAQACDAAGLFRHNIILSGGGSALFDIAEEVLSSANLSKPVEVLIRSGCYLIHDEEMYGAAFEQLLARSPAAQRIRGTLQPALQVWTYVQSKPDPGRAICALGKRDVGSDAQLPKPVAWVKRGERAVRAMPAGYKVVKLNDQHAYVDGPAAMPFEVGDLIGFGISHPCTTMDKWRALLVVDDEYIVQRAIRTYF